MLTARSGLYTPEQYRDALVMIAADLDHRSGRAWRQPARHSRWSAVYAGSFERMDKLAATLDYYDEDVY